MAFYRGNDYMSQEFELQSILGQETMEASSISNFSGRVNVLRSHAFWRPFKCVGVIYILLNMSGIFIILGYSASFLEVR